MKYIAIVKRNWESMDLSFLKYPGVPLTFKLINGEIR